MNYHKEYYQKNKEKIKARSNLYYKNNREKVLETVTKYRKENRDIVLERKRRYKRENKDKVNALNASRRAYKGKAAIGNFKEEIKDIYMECEFMTIVSEIDHHVDHIHPLKGKNSCGLHVPWNLQILTKEENLKKGNKLEVE